MASIYTSNYTTSAYSIPENFTPNADLNKAVWQDVPKLKLFAIVQFVKRLPYEPMMVDGPLLPAKSEFARRIRSTKLGVVWHTTYSGGDTLADMSASFGADVSKLRRNRNVWFDDATYRDVSGKMLFTKAETTLSLIHI